VSDDSGGTRTERGSSPLITSAGAQHDGHIPLPAGLRGIQLAAIKGDKNHLRDSG
jgi:hypothetical protein